MDIGERGLERAEEFERLSKEAEVARIRSSLEGPGEELCRECGDPVEEDRRKALPSATRCFPCQNIIERRRKGLK